MVMKQTMMGKKLRRTIKRSLGRYIAIVAIIALGAGMFVGLRSTKKAMIATTQHYTDEQNMFDLRLLSTYGWYKSDVDKIARMDGVETAEGSITLDVIGQHGDSGSEAVYRLHSVPQQVSKVYLLGGRMPQSPNECLVDGAYANDHVIGTRFTVSATNEEDTLNNLHEHSFTVVGYISTPLYMDMTRGSTTLGNGSVTNYVYIPEDAFAMDYYTEIGVTIYGDHEIYTDAFADAMKEMADRLKPGATVIADERGVQLKADAEAEYADGLAQYEDGLAEFETGKREALDQLADALAEIEKGQAEIDENRATLLDGEAQLAEGETTLVEAEAALVAGRQELANAKSEAYSQIAAGYAELTENYKAVSVGLAQVEDGLAELDEGIALLETGLKQADLGLAGLELLVGVTETGVKATQTSLDLANLAEVPDEKLILELEEQLSDQTEKWKEYTTQRDELAASREEYGQQLEELRLQRQEVLDTQKELNDAMETIELGMMELENSKLQADNQFVAAEAELEAGQIQLDAGRKELEAKKLELEQGRLALDEAQATLDQGRADYETGKAEAEAELAQAEAELADAKAKLDEAREAIDSMGSADVYILDRNTNTGYLAVNSNSDIVQGVSKVFPAFFLLIAALVCITTMTRMVDEERTQIGTLKALGYSNGAIINKYLVYTGSAAVAGCGLGVIIGSVVFPMILWGAYGIILNITPTVRLVVDWPLCTVVTLGYTAVSMAVTWYCCRRELREVPAELIRPKAPTAGKKIFLEYLPFWDKISFLNKVMFRNVFRYHQRLLMMLVGIGGCTALLLTGFGLRDSIVGIVDYQFQEVTTYDMQVYFSGGQTEQEQELFRDALGTDVSGVFFYHQTSADLEFDDAVREVSLVACDDGIRQYINFKKDGEYLGMPGVGQAYLSIGIAEIMGVDVGDTVTVRNADLQTMTLTVTGIFDNQVYNFVIVRPETVEAQWGEIPPKQMAVISVPEGSDPHEVSAVISTLGDVMHVNVTADQAEQVGSMLDALDLVVVTVVICAGLLAVIVLYNLTNISITERIREIATIKVLGFNAKESALYVFKENLLLTGLGALVGLLGGVFLLEFVMSQIKIDFVWFWARLRFPSYIWAILLTVLSALVVDFLLYFKLEKINMAEALKSVE